MFERYTEKARRVLFFARYESTLLGSTTIEPEHLLLGLLREGTGITSRLFAKSGVSVTALRTEIENQAVFQEKLAMSVEIPFSGATKRVLQYTAEEADRLSHSYISEEHILLGLLREEPSPAAGILARHGLRLDTVRNDIVTLLTEQRNDPSVFEHTIAQIKLLVLGLSQAPVDSDQARDLVRQINLALDVLSPPQAPAPPPPPPPDPQ